MHERDQSVQLRIGELSRRVGVSTELLRAWKRRYDVLTPARTAGGFRLYSVDDVRRVLRVLEHLRAGVSAAAAARLCRGEQFLAAPDDAAVAPTPGELGEPLRRALHFASALLRGRLLGLARGWGSGGGPLGLLACVPGDQHDLGLICFGLGLRGHRWRITFLDGLAEVMRAAPLALAGAGVDSSIADALGARYLEGDPVTAVARVAEGSE